MNELLFGTAGKPHSSSGPHSEDGIARVKELGLGCMELEFVHRVSMGERKAETVRQAAQDNKVRLSVHAPYYVNLNSKEKDKLVASKERVLNAARVGALCGADSVVFHPAFYMGDPPEKTYTTVKKHLEDILRTLRSEGNTICMRPETMGKGSQFGSLEEVLQLSAEIEGVMPCVDFSHLHARSAGHANRYDEFAEMLDLIAKRLGKRSLANIHIHLSGIEYGDKGERKHLNMRESDFNYRDLLKALKDFNVKGHLVCESPNLEDDALLLQQTYRAL